MNCFVQANAELRGLSSELTQLSRATDDTTFLQAEKNFLWQKNRPLSVNLMIWPFNVYKCQE